LQCFPSSEKLKSKERLLQNYEASELQGKTFNFTYTAVIQLRMYTNTKLNVLLILYEGK